MKFFRLSLILILFCFHNIHPQNSNTYIASVSVDDDQLNNQIEKLELPNLYLTETQLLTIITSEHQDVLKKYRIKYTLLDDFRNDDKLFLITSKSIDDLSSKTFSDKIIYSDRNSVIVKNSSLTLIEALASGYQIAELNPNFTYKNERRIWKGDIVFTTDTLITQITSSINQDSVRFFIQSLQNFQTRFLFANTRDAVADWIKNQFLQMGLTDVVVDSFLYQGTWQKNVVATLQGVYEPEVYNVVGGHHDSYSSGDPMVYAPGADDNASGTAAVLEIARVLMANNYQSESTVKFVTFAAEEYGLWGSKDYAQKALLAGMNIKIMINHDMISHTYSPANQSSVDINRYTGFEYLRDLAFYCVENYSVLSANNGGANSSGSDSHSFWQRGFPAVYFEETNFSPFYHSPADTIGNYNMEYCAEVIKSSCATLLMSIVMPSMVQNYNLVDAGTGNSLKLTWSPNQSPDFESYKIYMGTQSGVYDSVFFTVDTLFTVGNLTEGNIYYVGVSVVDQDGYESLIVERSATPYLFPLAPSGFSVAPLWHKVELSWNHNSEADILGYNIYRSEVEGEPGSILNSSTYSDTVYIDNAAASGVYYYYSITAVDSQLNESESTIELRSRIVSLDQGILIVDETADGNGTIMNPTDQQVDDFYDEILAEFTVTEYDLIEMGAIDLADLGAYSTIIWHGNDYQDFNAPFNYKQSIKEYLDYGGNFLYTGYRPAKAFENMSGSPAVFGNGHFIYDYLKIDSTYFKITSLYIGALSKASYYNSIFVDSSKTLAGDNYHLRFIEAILPNSEGVQIYAFDSNYDSSTVQGNLKGKPVGVEYLGSDFKTITLSFPLYYKNKESAKELLEFILVNKFNEVLPVEDEIHTVPNLYVLEQNYPNPFNPVTKILWQSPEGSWQTLKIYDVLGNEIATLVDEYKSAGKYEVEFNAATLSGSVSAKGGYTSGVYFYQLKAGNFVQTRKMILLK
jgi:hypothetical protein